ncbi:MAG: fibronectin type III domain-containing protein, partial [Ilumatobacter sp.]|nr:fibronectin type III domain-containing protein [Ilumatobacter sp.]
KSYAADALALHDRWQEQYELIEKEFKLEVALAVSRLAIILGEVAGLFMTAFKALAAVPKLKRIKEALDNLDEARELLDTVNQIVTAFAPIKGLMTTLASQISQEVMFGNSDNAKNTAALIDESVKSIKGLVISALAKVQGDTKLIKLGKTFGNVLPVVSSVITVVQQVNGLMDDYTKSVKSIEAMTKGLDNFPPLWEFLSGQARTYWKAYIDALTNEKEEDDPDKPKRPLPPIPPGRPGKKKNCGGVAVSYDPNEIVGPVGWGDDQWLQPGDLHFYSISFENLGPGSEVIPPGASLATAPAATVTVSLPLDDDLDLTTFELGDFGFAETRFEVPAGRQQFETSSTVTMELQSFEGEGTEEVDLSLRAKAWLDVPNRTANWLIELVDPATGEPHPDPAAGFLPPEPVTPEGAGQGFAELFVESVGSSPTGTDVDATATIVFDTNEPIVTNTWTNRLDRSSPTSSMSGVGATTEIGGVIGWSGVDTGSGAATYDVWRKIGDGPFALWLDDTPLTEVEFDGEAGVAYGFAVAASDGVGNVEAMPTGVQVTTTAVDPPPGPTAPSAPRQVGATAGNARATVSWIAPASNGGATITKYTVTSAPGGKQCTTTGALSCTVTGLTNGTSYTFRVRATNSAGSGPWSGTSPSVTPKAPVVPSSFVPLVPARLLDTRPGESTSDGVGAGGGRVAAGSVVEV